MASGEHTREYLTMKRNVTGMVDVLTTQDDPSLFAQKLCEAGLVSSYVVQKASVRDALPAIRVLEVIQAVMPAVKLDSSKYHDFVKVLRDVHQPLADSLSKHYGSNSRDGSAASPLPSASNLILPEEEKEEDRESTEGHDHSVQPVASFDCTRGRVVAEANISFDFAALYCRIVPLLAKAVKVDDLKRYLRTLRHDSSNQQYIPSRLYQHLTSVEEILDVLEEELYFHRSHINLFARIVNVHGCPECKRLLREYESTQPSCKRPFSNLSYEEVDRSRTTKKIKVEVEEESIGAVQEALEKATGVIRDMIIPVKRETACILYTFLVPETMVEAFTSIRESEEKLSGLAAAGILLIEVVGIVMDVKARRVRHKPKGISAQLELTSPQGEDEEEVSQSTLQATQTSSSKAATKKSGWPGYEANNASKFDGPPLQLQHSDPPPRPRSDRQAAAGNDPPTTRLPLSPPPSPPEKSRPKPRRRAHTLGLSGSRQAYQPISEEVQLHLSYNEPDCDFLLTDDNLRRLNEIQQQMRPDEPATPLLLTAENLRRHDIITGTYELRQFACGLCENVWWRIVPKIKPVSQCWGGQGNSRQPACGKQRYDALPRHMEYGIGRFICQMCGHVFYRKCQATSDCVCFGVNGTRDSREQPTCGVRVTKPYIHPKFNNLFQGKRKTKRQHQCSKCQGMGRCPNYSQIINASLPHKSNASLPHESTGSTESATESTLLSQPDFGVDDPPWFNLAAGASEY